MFVNSEVKSGKVKELKFRTVASDVSRRGVGVN